MLSATKCMLFTLPKKTELVFCGNNTKMNAIFSFQNVHDAHNTGSATPAFCPVRKPLNRERVASVSGGVLEIHNSLTSFCFRKLGMAFVKINNSKSYGVFWQFLKRLQYFQGRHMYRLMYHYPFTCSKIQELHPIKELTIPRSTLI